MKKETVQMWFQRIARCQELQNSKTKERNEIIKLYTSSFFGSVFDAGQENIDENFVYEYVQVVISAIYARDPYFFVRTKNTRLGEFAETMEIMLNDAWKTKKGKQKTKKAILDAILQTPGFLEIGYLFMTEFKKSLRQIEEEFPELKKIGDGKTEEEIGILDETIKEDEVFLNHVSSRDILWPDGYHEIRECPYLIKKQTTTLELILSSPAYKHKDKLNKNRMTGDKISNGKMYNMQSLPTSKGYSPHEDLELISMRLFHVFDRMNRKRFTLAEGFLEDNIFEADWDYLNDGHVIYPLIFNEVPKTDDNSNSFGLSDIVPMIPQLKELSFITSAMMRHRKRAGTLLLAKSGIIDETKAAKIQQASDVDIIILDQITEEVIKGFTPPSLPQDFYALRGIILESLMRISGYNQLLGVARGVQTATESENIRAGAVLRQSEKIDIIEEFTISVAQGLAALLWEYTSKERVMDIIGEMPTENQWPELPQDREEARKIINRLLRFSIEAGSMRPPKDEAVERKQWMDVISIIKASFPGRLNDSVVLKQLLKKFDFRDIERAVLGYDDMEIQAAQEENKLLLQGIPQVVTPNENDMLHLQVHSSAYETPGINITPQMDEHLLKHKQNYEMKNPSVLPQKGDSKISPKSTAPEKFRAGVTQFPDIMGAINSMSGMGGEKGGRSAGM